MIRFVFVAALISCPAWATGERVRLTAAAEPLREALCVSMECVTEGPVDAIVSAQVVREGLELSVNRRTVLTAALVDGQLSSFDAIRASAALVSAIEGRAPTAPKTQPRRAVKAKAAPLKLVARR